MIFNIHSTYVSLEKLENLREITPFMYEHWASELGQVIVQNRGELFLVCQLELIIST